MEYEKEYFESNYSCIVCFDSRNEYASYCWNVVEKEDGSFVDVGFGKDGTNGNDSANTLPRHDISFD
ncbi:hypothetical protein [Phocaeicola sartorii]|uniref:hypothetical protein n=1 Tax=Phocaeicola sartorii TaxID=671267 RepID=UPI00242FB1B3|nr:hypothetical protein [Phocaeicola sartorii]